MKLLPGYILSIERYWPSIPETSYSNRAKYSHTQYIYSKITIAHLSINTRILKIANRQKSASIVYFLMYFHFDSWRNYFTPLLGYFCVLHSLGTMNRILLLWNQEQNRADIGLRLTWYAITVNRRKKKHFRIGKMCV